MSEAQNAMNEPYLISGDGLFLTLKTPYVDRFMVFLPAVVAITRICDETFMSYNGRDVNVPVPIDTAIEAWRNAILVWRNDYYL